MIRKAIGSLIFLAVVVIVILCLVLGKDQVKEIGKEVLEKAEEKLTEQVEEVMEEYGLEVVEIRPAVDLFNDEGGEHQFFCAALVQTNSEKSAEDCAKALKLIFDDAGTMEQTDRKVTDVDVLVHRGVTYRHEDYSEGNYYTVYVYIEDVEDHVDLEALAEKLKG